MNLTIVKLGGSLMGSPELSLWLNSLETASKQENIVIVPGGGKFADSIRNKQKQYHFSDVAAHKMAMLAMCQYAFFLKDMNDKLFFVESENEISANLGKKLPLLWMPYSLIKGENTELEASWNVTSDSIAAWLAQKLEADKLILVKSKELSSDKSEIKNHIKNNDLDSFFKNIINNFSGETLFLSKRQYAQM